MAKAIPVNMKSNVNDFHRIEKRLAQVKAELAADAKMTQKEKDAKFESVLVFVVRLFLTGMNPSVPAFYRQIWQLCSSTQRIGYNRRPTS